MLKENNESQENEEETESTNRGMIKLQNVNSSWLANPVVNTLINIDLTIEPGIISIISHILFIIKYFYRDTMLYSWDRWIRKKFTSATFT